MAGQRENNEVNARPSHRTVSLWSDVTACLENIRMAEFYLGYLPEKPRGELIDHEAVQIQLQDARRLLGSIALDLTEGAADA